MYLLPKQAMELLQITTRQGLHKIVKNHNVTVKSQGAGKPNLYLKQDLEKYMKDNAKNISKTKTKTVIEKAKKKVEKKKKTITRNKKAIEETKKDLKLEDENWTIIEGKENIDKVLKEFQEKDIKEIKQEQDQQLKNHLDLPKDDEIENPLNKVGMAEYERVTNLLKEQGTYKEVDRALVLAYAISYQKYIFSTVASGKQDDTTSDDFGNLKLHPYFLVAKESFNQMEKIAKLLGIGARSRVGLEIAQPKKESIFDVLNSKEEF